MSGSTLSQPALAAAPAPGGNLYVGPSLASSLLKVAAALATARR
jgi:2-keto-3-deoxy-6-phosphogluconate aldolase